MRAPDSDIHYMRKALNQAEKALEKDEKVKGVELVKATGVDEPELEEVLKVSAGDEFSPDGETEEKSEKKEVPTGYEIISRKTKKTRHWAKAADKIQEWSKGSPGEYWKAIGTEDIKNWENHTTKELNQFIKKYMK